MDRVIKERYKYTSPEPLLAAGLAPVREELIRIEAAPTLFKAYPIDDRELAAWSTADLKNDPLWQENLNTERGHVQGAQIRITERDCLAEGVISIHIRYPAGTGKGEKAVIRNTIALEENTQARIVVYHHHSENPDLVVNTLTTIKLDSGSVLELLEILETKASAGDTIVLEQDSGSRAKITTIDLDNRLLRRNQFVSLKGSGAECELSGIYLTDGNQQADNYVKIYHAVPDCHSNQLFKGIAEDRSTGTFTGHIYVAPDAQRTLALQENHNILLSEEARINTRPQLEIYADDVKCNHGATIGKLDQEAIYYMRQRGISFEAAKRLQIEGFVGEIVEQCQMEDLRHLLHTKISQRLMQKA